MIAALLVAVLTVRGCGAYVARNNVCGTFRDYATIDTNVNCWYNPDVGSSPRLIAKRYGYPFERHTVTTEDGYILDLHRIPGGYKAPGRSKRIPVLLQHGAGGVSAFWMLQGNNSVAFVLANQGYDVWLLNHRGTYYSSKHQRLTTNDPQYWNFGFHDVAVYDLPACIEYVASKTGSKGNLIYVGHSMGTTTSYVYSMIKKGHARDHLSGIVSLAPVAYMGNVTGMFKLIASSVSPIKKLAQSFGINAVGQFHRAQSQLLALTCGRYPLIRTCHSVVAASSGIAPEQVQPELLPVFLSYYPSALSLKTLEHYSQLINNATFSWYDHGPSKNVLVYSATAPPVYDVSKIELPLHLFIGTADIIGNAADAAILYDKTNSGKTNTQTWRYFFPFAHNDFFLAKDVGPFYEKLLSVLDGMRATASSQSSKIMTKNI
ncbi:lipase member K-like [Cylas formicarius]|uniref:lipase member K-like n=1 Tax=Cylas formicarius TaxID=197179 RepID=UPI00295883CD|nr:lipase member K-like [Cylas formicarius]